MEKKVIILHVGGKARAFTSRAAMTGFLMDSGLMDGMSQRAYLSFIREGRMERDGVSVSFETVDLV